MKKHLKILIGAAVIIAIILIIVLVVVKQNGGNKNNNAANQTEQNIVSTKKIMNYIDIINKDYYMKYKTTTTDESGKTTVLNAEYAIKSDKVVVNDLDTLTTTLATKDATYYILHDNKTVLVYPIAQQNQEGALEMKRGYTKQFFESAFVGTGSEDIDGVQYYYEEYNNASQGGTVKYYFDSNDKIKYIRNIVDTGKQLTEVLEISNNIYDELFKIPSDYKQYDMTNITNTIV